MSRRPDLELIELIDPSTGDDVYAPLATSPRTDTAAPNRRRPIVAALAATVAIVGVGVWLQSTESTPAPSPAAATTASTSSPPTPPPSVPVTVPRPPGEPPRYVGEAPAGMYLVGSRSFGPPSGGWSYSVWATPDATSASGRWIAVQAWPGTLDDVALTDGWRHLTANGEVFTAFDSLAAQWIAWSDGDPADGVVMQTLAYGWTEAELLSLVNSLKMEAGEINLGAGVLQLRQTGSVLRNDLLGGDGISDTLVNPDDGNVLSVHVSANDPEQEPRFDSLAGLLLRPTAKIVTGAGAVAITYDTGNWFGRSITRFTDREWTITVASSLPAATTTRFVGSMTELTTASDGYGKVSSRYPPDPQASAWLTAGREGIADWRVVRSGDQLTWELRFGGVGSVYQQRLAVRGESAEMVTLHSLSVNGFTAVWASAPDDGRALMLGVEEAGGGVTVEPLRSVDSFSGKVLAAHVFSEAQAFTAVVVDDSGQRVAEWPTRGSPEE